MAIRTTMITYNHKNLQNNHKYAQNNLHIYIYNRFLFQIFYIVLLVKMNEVPLCLSTGLFVIREHFSTHVDADNKEFKCIYNK